MVMRAQSLRSWALSQQIEITPKSTTSTLSPKALNPRTFDFKSLEAGERVKVKRKGWGKGFWGVIERCKRDGTYEVHLDNGHIEENVRMKEILQSKSPKGGQEKFSKGQKIEALVSPKRGRYQAAEVIRTHADMTYDVVLLDSGKQWFHVPTTSIRPRNDVESKFDEENDNQDEKPNVQEQQQEEQEEEEPKTVEIEDESKFEKQETCEADANEASLDPEEAKKFRFTSLIDSLRNCANEEFGKHPFSTQEKYLFEVFITKFEHQLLVPPPARPPPPSSMTEAHRITGMPGMAPRGRGLPRGPPPRMPRPRPMPMSRLDPPRPFFPTASQHHDKPPSQHRPTVGPRPPRGLMGRPPPPRGFLQPPHHGNIRARPAWVPPPPRSPPDFHSQ